MLLWSIIERYVTFRIKLGKSDLESLKKFASEERLFREWLEDNKEALELICRDLYRADKPAERKISLVYDDPEKAIDYFYQIRCNISHHGKSMIQDTGFLRNSTKYLLDIFVEIKKAAFEESASYLKKIKATSPDAKNSRTN